MDLFIDANIYLDFFFYSQDDLEELRKLEVLLRQQRTTLWLPQQVADEVARKRESQIDSALKVLRDQKLDLRFPQICLGYSVIEDLRRLQREYALAHDKLVKAVEHSAREKALTADEVIKSLFAWARKIPINEQQMTAARNRMDRGNPPGKDKKLGDAINWESLLEAVTPGADLHLVTADRDFSSILDRQTPNSFLKEEWSSLKGSNLYYYGRLTDFLKQHFPTVKLAEDLERAILVERLAASTSFAQTHLVVAQLSTYDSFSLPEIEALLQAVDSNNQVHWIINDPDVNSFVARLLQEAQGKVQHEILARVHERLAEHHPPGRAEEDATDWSETELRLALGNEY